MIDETFDKLLEEFLIHKDSSTLKEYITSHLSGDSFDKESMDSAQTICLTTSEFGESSLSTYSPASFSFDDSVESKQTNQTDTTFEKSASKRVVDTFPSEVFDSIHIGPYQRQDLLGKGGMGMVWQVRDPVLNRTVALKILHNDSDDDTAQSDFDEEAQISSQLQHPGIIPVYSYDRTNSQTPYLTMKEIRGKTLKAIIREVHILPKGSTTSDGWSFRRTVTAFLSVCETMAYAHTKGVIHRDLKPSNIMVGKFGEVLVVDWGIAKVIPISSTQLDLSLIHI